MLTFYLIYTSVMNILGVAQLYMNKRIIGVI